MSYISKKDRVFMEGPPIKVVKVRSEARMKNYVSSTDIRAWSDVVEDRRQHILEYMARNKEGYCFDKDFPLDALFDAMMACKNHKIRKLLKKIEYCEKLLRIYSQLDLTPEQQKKVNDLMAQLKKAYDALEEIDCNKPQLIEGFSPGGADGGYSDLGDASAK
ncbi:hypothetical protein NQ317_003131, partial [Molorchus minor]